MTNVKVKKRDDGLLVVSGARLSFPALHEPDSYQGSDPKFKATFLIPKSETEAVEALEAAMDAVGAAKFGAKWEAVKKTLAAKDALAIHDGDAKTTDGYADHVYINANNKSRPFVLDRDRTPLVAADGKPYGGCYVVGAFEFWAQDNNYGKRVNASLRGVQFLRDGESFGGGAALNPDDVFETIDDDDDDWAA